jgi:hypothetical protein
MSILYRGPSIAATYQVSVHFAKWFAHLGSVNKHGQHRQFVVLIGRFPKNFYSETALAK